MDVKPEVVVAAAGEGRAEDFCEPPGRRPDVGLAGGGGLRAVQFTPPAWSCSVFGARPPSARRAARRACTWAVFGIETAHAERADRGVGVFRDAGGWCIAPGPRDTWQARNPAAVLCSSFLSFGDPDGNGRLLQEITARLSGRWPGTMPGRIRAVDKVPGSCVRGRRRQRLRRPARPAGRLGDVRVPFHDPGLSKPAYANAPHVRANDMEKGTTPCAPTSHPVEPSPTTS